MTNDTTPQYWAVFKDNVLYHHTISADERDSWMRLWSDHPELCGYDLGQLEAIGYYSDSVVVLTVDEYSKKDSEIKALREAIQKYLDGDYINPRSTRPNKCQHGKNYYEDCQLCIDEHFIKALGENSNG